MKKASILLTILFSGVFIAGGVFLFFTPIQLIGIFATVCGVLFVSLGCARIAFFLFERGVNGPLSLPKPVLGIISLVCGIFLLAYPGIAPDVVRITLAVWTFFSGGIQLISAYAYYGNREKQWIVSLVWGIVTMTFSIFLFAWKDMWLFVLSTVIAAYLVLLGLTGFARIFVAVNQKKKNRRNVPLPMWLEAFLPGIVLQWVRSSLEWSGDHPPKLYSSENLPPETPSCVEVLVHLSGIGTNVLGHVDVAVDGHVFSYGNYDHSKSNIRLFGLLWDGVFAICDRDEYIRFSLEHARKTIIGYTLRLDPQDAEKLKANIARFIADCTPWAPIEPRQNGYANALKKIGAQLFKLRGGKFKTYFMLNTNCALLADEFFAGTSMPRARAFGGTVTPGTFLSLYENELEREGSPVVKRTLYASERMVSMEAEEGKKLRKGLASLQKLFRHIHKPGQD